MSKFVLLFVTALLSNPALASLDSDYDALKDSGVDFQVVGTICEQVARLQLAREFQPPAYNVITGIAYGDGNRTIGELDVVVFDTKTNEAVQIAEVKCWKDLKGGLDKAHDQRSRFLKAVKAGKASLFRSTTTKEHFSRSQFKHVQEFVSIAQNGSVAAGFDEELEHSLDDLMGMRTKIMQCQQTAECTRP